MLEIKNIRNLNCSDLGIFSLYFVLQEFGHLLRSAGELGATLHFSSILLAKMNLVLQTFNFHSALNIVSKLLFQMTENYDY